MQRKKSSKRSSSKPETPLFLFQAEATNADNLSRFKKFWKESGYPGKVQSLCDLHEEVSLEQVVMVPKMKQGQFSLFADGELPEELKETATWLAEVIATPHLIPWLRHCIRLVLRKSGSQIVLLIQNEQSSYNASKALKRFCSLAEKELAGISILQISSMPRIPFSLESGPSQARWTAKTLSGNGEFALHSEDSELKRYLDPLEKIQKGSDSLKMAHRIRDMIRPRSGDGLFHLFSGSPLLSLEIAKDFSKVQCVDIRKSPRNTLQSNLKHNKIQTPIKMSHFSIEPNSIEERCAKLLDTQTNWTFLFTPPTNQELSSGLIKACARMEVPRVLRVFRSLKVMNQEIPRWKHSRFMVRKVVPFWLKNESAPVVAVLIAPDREGVLQKKYARQSQNSEEPGIRFIQGGS
jgi:hypothetical protein